MQYFSMKLSNLNQPYDNHKTEFEQNDFNNGNDKIDTEDEN